jgi:hypothetical protein
VILSPDGVRRFVRFPACLVTVPYLGLLLAAGMAASRLQGLGGSLSGLSPGLLVSGLRVDVGGHDVRLACDGLTELANPIHCQVLYVDMHPVKCVPLGTSQALSDWLESQGRSTVPPEGWGSQPTLAAFLDKARPERTLGAAVSLVYGLIYGDQSQSGCRVSNVGYWEPAEERTDWMIDSAWDDLLLRLPGFLLWDYLHFWLSFLPGAPRSGIGPGEHFVSIRSELLHTGQPGPSNVCGCPWVRMWPDGSLDYHERTGQPRDLSA